ncbi:multicopper oxidase domain-containing protein [Herbiconiux sp. SYSU D00978]|uniref:multicopper oxidase domain-containing protein n=1 Tax=Herbiconiux sp. SYSU D00978 TaxID=2812562 RepID=UPI001F611118|nr:multicopper oxidase domain-containing protein [Herbiconiux sp. SYSU D00978]
MRANPRAFEVGTGPALVDGAAVLDVFVNEGHVPMVDGALVYHRGFGDEETAPDAAAPNLVIRPRVFTADGRIVQSSSYPLDAPVPPKGRPAPAAPDPQVPLHQLARRRHWASYFPDRTLIAETGSTVRLRVHNRLPQPHELTFHGAGAGGSAVGTGPIPPGGTRELSFAAPPAGTYVYSDPGNAPVERTLGLFGVLLVVDAAAAWQLSSGGPEFERQWLWICHDVEPEWARAASRGQRVDPATMPAVPRYFTLNGRSGFESLAITVDEELNALRKLDTLPSGFPRATDVRDFSRSPQEGTVRTGQLIRMVNAGIVGHQLHFHGNHVWTLRSNGTDFPRSGGRVSAEGRVILQHWEDTVDLDPLDRTDSMLPFKRPPDVLDAVWNARGEDWVYPMHCHAEPSQTAAGGLYPGGLVADWVLAAKQEETPHHRYRSQVEFASDQPDEGSPETRFRTRPSVAMTLDFFGRELRFPDGSEHDVWSFESGDSGRGLPGPLVRVTEGQVMHGTIKPSKAVHTIHWHGIEPDPRNDGVGHTSFEVSGSYTYQWRGQVGVPGDPNTGTAGTYFYHCHVNTTLHVQMGMFGPVIIDPPPGAGAPLPAGVRRYSVDGPEYDVATETLLIPYSVDPRWHELSHAAGLSGEDVGLNRFVPRHFVLLGGAIATRPRGDRVWSLSSMRANLPGGDRRPTLLRFVNADYFPMRIRFTDGAGQPVPMAELVGHDGRPFWHTDNPTGPATPVWRSGSRLLTSLIKSGAAEKYDVLLRPPAAGQYRIHVDFLHWVTGRIAATRTVQVTAS